MNNLKIIPTTEEKMRMASKINFIIDKLRKYPDDKWMESKEWGELVETCYDFKKYSIKLWNYVSREMSNESKKLLNKTINEMIRD